MDGAGRRRAARRGREPAGVSGADRRQSRPDPAGRDQSPPGDVRRPVAAGAAGRAGRGGRRRGPCAAHRVGVARDAGGPGVADPAGARGVRAARGVRLPAHGDRGDHRAQPGGRTAAGSSRARACARPAAAVRGASASATRGDRAVRAGCGGRGHRRADGDPRAGRDGVDGRRRQAQARGSASRARPGQGGPALRLVRAPRRRGRRPSGPALPAGQRRRRGRAVPGRGAVRRPGPGPHAGRRAGVGRLRGEQPREAHACAAGEA